MLLLPREVNSKCFVCFLRNCKELQIMALPIRPIPILKGKEALRFIEAAEAAEQKPFTMKSTISRADFRKMMAKSQLLRA